MFLARCRTHCLISIGEDNALARLRRNHLHPAAADLVCVDVVIPMRNGASTIQATLASVLAQTVQPRRIIIVDDGSDDAGAALVSGNRLVEIIRTEPIGVSHARNAGIQSSSADYVAFLDSDDLWRPDKLERQLEIAVRNPQVAVVSCDQVHVHMSGGAIPWTRDTRGFGARVFEDIISHCFMRGGWSSSILVRRRALLECAGFDERLQFSEDVDLCLRLARHYPFDHSAECLVYIRENPGSTTRRQVCPEWHLEVALQQLSVVEKWIPAEGLHSAVLAQCVWVILTRFVRGPLRYGRLMEFRRAVVVRTPNLAARMARSETHFLFILGFIGILQLPRLLMAGLRYLVRRSSRNKAIKINAGRRLSPGSGFPPSGD